MVAYAATMAACVLLNEALYCRCAFGAPVWLDTAGTAPRPSRWSPLPAIVGFVNNRAGRAVRQRGQPVVLPFERHHWAVFGTLFARGRSWGPRSLGLAALFLVVGSRSSPRRLRSLSGGALTTAAEQLNGSALAGGPARRRGLRRAVGGQARRHRGRVRHRWWPRTASSAASTRPAGSGPALSERRRRADEAEVPWRCLLGSASCWASTWAARTRRRAFWRPPTW
ncbi:MAG: hypothetical protein ACLSVD_18175 [Eggerthellaceae bacterium]